MNEYKLGDEFWYIPGCYNDGLIVIRCKITEVDDEFRKRYNKDAALTYWLNEPIGHDVTFDELYSSFEEACDKVRANYETCKKYEHEFPEIVDFQNSLLNCDLMTWRRRSMNFIISTWWDAPEEEKNLENNLLGFPSKQRGVDWFNLTDLGTPAKRET